jgi:hypothetical protein
MGLEPAAEWSLPVIGSATLRSPRSYAHGTVKWRWRDRTGYEESQPKPVRNCSGGASIACTHGSACEGMGFRAMDGLFVLDACGDLGIR